MPELFETIVLPKDGIEGLPQPNVPYYVIAQEGPYLHKNTEIGNALLREWKTPTSLPKVGAKDGVFVWKGDLVPGHIVSQAHDFFRRIWNKHKTEAEVLITKHLVTGGYRLFVPTQRVSMMGVKSIYEPTHIDPSQYVVVGTLHSHCNFTAFHSGTDSGDASDMDGVHFTIGKVDQPVPEIVAMVVMGGIEFHYKPTDIAHIEFNEATAPEWWDQYVYPENGKVPGEKPETFVSLTQEHWDEFLGRALVKPKVHKWTPPPTRKWGDDRPTGTPQYSWMPKPTTGRDVQISDYYKNWRDRDIERFQPMYKQPAGADGEQINTGLDIAEEFGLFTDDDWQLIKPEDVDSLLYWQGYFLARMQNLIEVLGIFGVDADGDQLKPLRKKPSRRRLRR